MEILSGIDQANKKKNQPYTQFKEMAWGWLLCNSERGDRRSFSGLKFVIWYLLRW